MPRLFAIPAYAGIPVTDKKVRSVHIVDVSPDGVEPDWSAANGAHQTLVLINIEGSVGKVAAASLRGNAL